jgi:GR25 family glycosyltransferase involved in LPS biosynthesis
MTELESFPPIYYINLDRRQDRDKHIKKLLATYKLKGVRVPAVDGKNLNSFEEYVDVHPPNLKPVQIACTISHLQTIRYWLENSDTDTAVICEDDVSFETVSSWGSSWKDIMTEIPSYWDILQLCIIYHPKQDVIINLHHRTMYDFSAACYMINRRYAQKLMSLYWNEDTKKWKLHGNNGPFPLTSEEAVYRPGACLSIPLFTFTNTMGSDIQSQDHLDQYHLYSKKLSSVLWSNIKVKQLLSMWPLQMIKK